MSNVTWDDLSAEEQRVLEMCVESIGRETGRYLAERLVNKGLAFTQPVPGLIRVCYLYPTDAGRALVASQSAGDDTPLTPPAPAEPKLPPGVRFNEDERNYERLQPQGYWYPAVYVLSNGDLSIGEIFSISEIPILQAILENARWRAEHTVSSE